jgi:hypothetical protein
MPQSRNRRPRGVSTAELIALIALAAAAGVSLVRMIQSRIATSAQRAVDCLAGGSCGPAGGGSDGRAGAASADKGISAQELADKVGPARSGQSATVGGLSTRYETGGRGPGVVSSGHHDPGGVSYGSYQMKSENQKPKEKRECVVCQFVNAPDFQWRDRFKGLEPGTPEFKAAWEKLAAADPAGFAAAQHAFIAKTHYDPQVARIAAKTGIDVSSRSHTLQDVVWSTAVQNGPKSKVVTAAYQELRRTDPNAKPTDPDYDRKLINAIYDERDRHLADGSLAHFSQTKKDEVLKKSLETRFRNERADALKALAREKGSAGSGEPVAPATAKGR